MTVWIWALIPLVAIIGGLFIEYQKNKMKMMDMSRQNEQEVEEIRKLVSSLKTRIENLEAIAAGDPDSFTTGAGVGMKEIEVDETDYRKENKQKVSDLADKRRMKS